MKICGKCGAYNSEKRFFCVDCAEKLGEPLSRQEEERLEGGIDAKMDKLYNDGDPLAVTRFDKVCGAFSVVGFVAVLVLLGIGLFGKCLPEDWELYLYAVVFFVAGAVDALVPKLNWTLEKIRLGVWYHGADDLEPSGTYRLFRRVSILLCIGFGIVFLSLVAIDLFGPAEDTSGNDRLPDGVVVITPEGSEVSFDW